MTESGMNYKDALAKATELGYAEADPTADVEGYDAGRKIDNISEFLSILNIFCCNLSNTLCIYLIKCYP